VVDATGREGLALEAHRDFVDAFHRGVQQLQCDGAPERKVLREIDAAHPAGTEDAGNAELRVQDVPDPRNLSFEGSRERRRSTPHF